MGIALAATNPGVLSFSTTVMSVDDREIILDNSYFYPEGGGQPPDRGRIAGIVVTDVQVENDSIVHQVESRPEFSVGDTVTAQIDPAFRAYCKRIHTASHVVYGAGRRVFDDLGYGGFGIDEEKARIDFATSSSISTEEVVELERLANRVVWEHRNVTWEVLPVDEALAIDGIAFNTKTEEGVMGDEIRVVEVDEWDVAACGGTHVGNTRDIGPISILERSNPGEGLTRIELSIGPPAISHRAQEKESLLKAADYIGAAPASLDSKLEEIDEKIGGLEQAKQRFKEHLMSAWKNQLSAAVVMEANSRWLVTQLDSPDTGLIAESAKAWVSELADVIVLVSPSSRVSVIVASNERSAEDIINSVVGEFGGGGGGNASFAQAGGLDAPAQTVVEFIEQQFIETT